MGSRGAQAIKENVRYRNIEITTQNGTKNEYYFNKMNDGTWVMSRSADKLANQTKTPGGLSPKEFVERAKANGAKVRVISEQEKIQKAKKAEKVHAENDKEMINAWYNDKNKRKAFRNVYRRNRNR